MSKTKQIGSKKHINYYKVFTKNTEGNMDYNGEFPSIEHIHEAIGVGQFTIRKIIDGQYTAYEDRYKIEKHYYATAINNKNFRKCTYCNKGVTNFKRHCKSKKHVANVCKKLLN